LLACKYIEISEVWIAAAWSKTIAWAHWITDEISKMTELLATVLEARVRFPALPEKKVVGLERGPLSLVSTTEELLDRKVATPV
jgi:hypothetical protein